MADALRSPFLYPVLGAMAVAYLPHALRLPLWVTLFCLCCWGFMLLGRRLGWRAPGKKWRNSLAIAGSSLLLLSYGGRLGLEAGVSVLAVLLAIKPLEMASRRDAMSSLLLTSFLIVFNLFFSQDIFSALMAVSAILALTAALLRTTCPACSARTALAGGLRLLLQGLPLALALFFVFPRLPGGILGYSAPATPSGFNDAMSPGEISTLALSRDVAFRVSFEDAPPPPEERYWRGAVLWDFDGRTWSAREDIPRLSRSLVGRDPVSYSVSLQPYGKNWLFALDLPLGSTDTAFLRQDYTLRSRVEIAGPFAYSLRSFTQYTTGRLLQWEYLLGTRLPEDGNPRARELAASWAGQDAEPREVALRCLEYFETQGFSYVLAPEEPEGDWLDHFLFSSKEGFCGHYAGAMTFLMRAAGVPARVVAGYHGGETNPLGDYMILRQSDAHAWVEVWLEDRGWVRLDPTGVVAPLRLTQGLLEALAGQEAGGQGVLRDLPAWMRSLQLGWDAVNYFWGRTVLDYGWKTQRSLLQRLGFRLHSWGTEILVGFLALGVVGLGFLALVLLRRLDLRRRSSADSVQRTWDRLCRRLGRAGLPRPLWQGPLEYAESVAAAMPDRPELAEALHAAAQYYAWLRYAPPELRASEEEFRRQAQRVRRLLRRRR